MKLYERLSNAMNIQFKVHVSSVGSGTSETKVFDEQSPSGNDYLAEVSYTIFLVIS